jgi:hypothetical protein
MEGMGTGADGSLGLWPRGFSGALRPAPCGVFTNCGHQKRAKIIAEYAVMLAVILYFDWRECKQRIFASDSS